MKRLGDFALDLFSGFGCVTILGVFWSGFLFGAMHADYRHSRGSPPRLAQAEHFDLLPGPETYTPAPPHPADPPPEQIDTPPAEHELPAPTPAPDP